MRRREPRWLTRAALEAIHAAQLREHGGSAGIRDEGLLESALARPQNKLAYGEGVEWADLAPAYAFGIAKNHPFVDGNKRSAFVAAGVFLRLNGFSLTVSEEDVVSTIENLAAGKLSERKLAAWFRNGMKRLGD